jgi:hypothetical protein
MTKPGALPLGPVLRLNSALRRLVFSRKFYLEINDKVLALTATMDRNLYFICYFTLLLLSVLDNKPAIRRFVARQRQNLARVLGLPVARDPKGYPAAAADAEGDAKTRSGLSVHLRAILLYLLDIRIFNRLTELIKYMPWIIDEYQALVRPRGGGAAGARLDRAVNLLQALNCLVLELLENAGWLTDHNWVATGDNAYWCVETYIWCLRVWGVYLVIEIIELFRRVPVAKWDRDWRINVFKQAVQVPLVLHWSLYSGCLTPFWVGVCGSCASWWDFKRVWGSIEL